MSYARPMIEQLREAEQALQRIHDRSARDEDLVITLDGLMRVIKELTAHRWAPGDEVAAQKS